MKKTVSLLAGVLIATLPFAAPSMAGGPKHCPPGLAKKGSCVPPGQAKKQYQVGQPLPATVQYVPVQTTLYPAPPAGTLYGQVDGDVLLIAEGTRRVIELIGIADALAN